MAVSEERRTFYPPTEAYQSGYLKVTDLHTLYFEQSGNPNGVPALFVHGGPEFGTSPSDRSFFDPKVYRIVVFDQRGSGKSTPGGELRDNTTWTSVEDIETLRKHLGIETWGLLFGGSWGSTLILAYSQAYPSKVKSMVIRGIYLARKWEIDWLYNGKGLNDVFPDFWEEFESFIPQGERHSILDAYYRRLNSDDPEIVKEASKRWSRLEMSSGFLFINQAKVDRPETDPDWAYRFARMECLFAVHGCFLRSQNQLLDDVDKIRHIPCTIVQGRYDMNCPVKSAWDLYRKWPEAELKIVPDAGHSSYEPGIISELIKATDKYRSIKKSS